MFEGLLEKILLAKIGKYIVGLDKDNLKIGVWGGDITLENVYLKPDALLLLQLPLLILYGKIIKLVIKVPWSKLSSSPVEVRLEGLSVILSTPQKQNWNYSEEGDIINRKELIDAHEQRLKQLQEQKLLSAEEELKEKSFLEKMSSKVLDNIRIVIQDIHLRFESSIDGRIFASGLTLEKIECFTTNSEWLPEFTDRHKAGFAGMRIFKVINVLNLGFYWKSGDESLQGDESVLASRMFEMIKNPEIRDYLITPINAQARLVHNNDLVNFALPELSIQLDFPEITVVYKQLNFHDTVKLFEYFAEYQQFLMKTESTRKYQMLMPVDRNPRNLWKSAIECIVKTIRHRKDRTVDHFIPKPSTLKYYEENFKMLHRKLKKTGKTGNDFLYDKIIFLNQIENLYLWASHVQSVIEKEAKVPEKKPATGFFGLWGKKVPPEQQKVVEETYNSLFKEIENNPLPQNSLLPKDYIKVRFELRLFKGAFKLVETSSGVEDSLVFSYRGLVSAACLKVEGFEVELSMDDMSLISERDQTVIIQKVTQEGNLWTMKFMGKPSSSLSWSLENTFESLQINYSLSLVQSIFSFFVVPKTQNSAKIAAWDTLKGIQDTTQGALTDLIVGDTQFLIKIKCSAPRLKLPSPTQQGEFTINLGDISITNVPGADLYENFELSINSIGMTYNKTPSESLPVVSEFAINSSVGILKNKFKYKPKNDLPELIFRSELPEFRIVWNASVYNQLMKLHKNFDFDLQSLEETNEDIKIEGDLKRLTLGMHAWKEVHTKLVGGYLYFGNTSTFYIKDCSLHDVSEEYKQENAIKLQNIYGDCVIAFASSAVKEMWVQVLSESINEFESRTSLATSSLKKNPNRIIYESSFKIHKTEIVITDEHFKTFCILQMNQLSSTIQVKELEFEFSGTLGQMLILEDSLKKFNTVFHSLEQRELIKIQVNYIDSKSNNYNRKGMIVEIKCGDVEITWNFDMIVDILNFFQFAEYSDPARMIEETYGVVDKDHVLLDLKIKSESLALVLVNHKNQLAIAELRVCSFDSNVLVQNEGYFVKGLLDKLEISDLTNYPATALIHKENQEINPYTLLKTRDNGDLLRFSLMIYSDKFKDRDLDTSSRVEVEMNGIDIFYLHQPMMRIVDYLNYYVLGVFDTQSRARKIDQSSMLKPEIFEEKLSFTSISVKINQPVVHLPPRPCYEDEFSINLGVITVQNQLDKANNPGWQDIYQVNMQKMHVFSRKQVVTDQFDLSLQVTRKILTSEHLKQKDLDKTYLIKGESQEIRLKLSQRDYNLLLRTSDLNLLYDDQLESLISPTYTYTPPAPGEFMRVQFTLPSVSVLMTYNSTEILNVLLLSSQVYFAKLNDTTILFILNSSNVLGLIPEAAVMSKSQDLKSMAEMVFSLSPESLESFEHVFKAYPFILFGPASQIVQSKQGKQASISKEGILEIRLRTDMQSNKTIDINIKSVRINFHLSLLNQILNYSVSGVPNYSASSETPQDYLTRYQPKVPVTYCVPRILANVNLTQSFIWLPSTSKNRVLVAQGDLSFLYLRERQGCAGPDSIKRLMLDKLEIFQSKSEEFLSQPRRKLVEPLQFIYEVKHYALEIKENYVIGSLNCALSYKDLVAIQSTYKYQVEMMEKDDSIINLLQGFDNLQIIEDRMKSSEDCMILKETDKKTITTYSFAGLNIILINDALTAYTPIVDLNLSIGDSVLKKESQDYKSCFRGGLQVSSSYYNPVSNTWEPFVEPFFIETELVSSKSESIKNQYIFSVPSDVVNVNCSEVMVKNLQEILDIWDSTSSSSSDVISPFQIRNDVGYTIMVEYKNTKDVAIVESGSSQDYVVDYYSRAKNVWKSDSITVSIFPGDFAPPKLKIKTSKVQCYSCKTGKQVLVVDIELKATRKILTVRSPLIIENQTDFSIGINFIKTGKIESREVGCLQSVPVPYDMITGVCNFEILGYKSNTNTNLENLWVKGKTSTIEVQVGSIFLYLYYKISRASANKRTLYIKPPLKIKNCVPLNLALRIYKGHPNKFEEIEVKQQEMTGIYSYSLKSELFLSISIEGFSRSNLFNILSSDGPSTVKVVDRKQQELLINVLRILEGCIFVVFHVSQIIINNSLNPLAFYQKVKGSEKMFPGQDFISTVLPCNKCKKLIIGLGNTRSKAFLTDSVGVKDIIELLGDTNPAGHSYKYQYTLDVQMSKIIESEMVFCKIIVISPRFLLVNNSNIDLLVSQDGFSDYPNHLTQGTRLPFHWAHKDGKELIRFKAKGENWVWSGAFSIDNLATFTVQCKNKQESPIFLLMKVEIKIVDTTAHVIFEVENLSTASYKLINDSRWFSLAVYQKSHAEDIRFIDSSQIINFAWSDHLSDNELIINFLLGKSHSESNDTHSMYILNLHKMNQLLRIKIKNAPVDFDVLYVSVFNEGPSKIVKFSDMPVQRMKEKSDVILAYFNFSIPKLGVSVIEHWKNKSKELFYLTFTSIVLLAQNTEKEIKAELMIKSFQGDNQMSPDTIFPVFIHPAEISIRNILHMCFVVNKDSLASVGCTNFETFEFLLQTFSLKLDTHSVNKLIELTDRLILKEKPQDLQDTLNRYRDFSKFYEVDKSTTRYFYFNFMQIHPIKIITTYAPLKMESSKKDLLSGIAQFGLAISSIEEAPIKLYPVQFREALASEKRIRESLKSHYKSQLYNEFYSLIGHSNILGNPIGLLNDLGTGVVDFFYEPAQGMVNGPISATEGLIKGTGSLIKNTVSGTFGTVSKITSGITTGLAALTQDSDYIAERQKDLAKYKPSNVVTGVGLGVMSFMKNIGQGITGLVTEPIKGFKKDKMEGMVKGGIKGIGGLFVKPVAGVFDMVSRSAEGIKNTANFNEELEFYKARYPRVIYGPLRVIQIYNDDDSVLLQHLFRLKKLKYYDKEFVEQITGINSAGKPVIIALFTDVILLISRQDGKIKWKVKIADIKSTDIREDFLAISVVKKQKIVCFKIDLKNEQLIRELKGKIDKMR